MIRALIVLLGVFMLNGAIFAEDKVDFSREREKLQYGKSYIVSGNMINIPGTGEVKVRPDIIIANFEAYTENEELEKASQENAETMNELKKYLLSIGVKEDDIETSRYTKGEKEIPLPESKQVKKYVTTFQVALAIKNDNFYEVTDILNGSGITELNKANTGSAAISYDSNVPSLFYFNIVTSDTNRDTSKKLAKEKYDSIAASLSKIDGMDISLFSYNVEEVQENITKKVYTITHDFVVKMSADTDMGKLIKKCETLKIKNPGDLSYDISPELRDKATLEAYNKAMKDIYARANMIIKDSEYELGDFSVTDNTSRVYPMPMPKMAMNNAYMDKMVVAEMESSSPANDDIPFAVSSEMKITVMMTANFTIIKKVK